MSKRKPRRKPRELLFDRISQTLEERTAAILSRGLPADADEFDRVCFEIMEGFLKFSASLTAKADPPKSDHSETEPRTISLRT